MENEKFAHSFGRSLGFILFHTQVIISLHLFSRIFYSLLRIYLQVEVNYSITGTFYGIWGLGITADFEQENFHLGGILVCTKVNLA